MKKILSSLLFLSLAGLSACGKFTDVQPKGQMLPTTVSDYEAFMNDLLFLNAGYLQCEFMTDDVLRLDATVTSGLAGRSSKGYLWMKDIFTQTEDDAEWNSPYNLVYYCNLVMDKIDGATKGADTTKARIKADALIQRSYYLFHLANLYGKDYTAGNTTTNLAVPILLKPDLEAIATRATVQQVNDLVINDLKTAIATPSLPNFGRTVVHPGKAAAMALLARVYFFQGDYKMAADWADSALAIRNTLVDYNTLSFKDATKPYNGLTVTTAPEYNTENLFSKNNNQSGIFTGFMISPDLLSVFDTKDLRFVFNFTKLTRTGTVSPNPYPDYLGFAPNFSIGVPEMMLIKAEYLARNSKGNEAMAILNTLRKKRFKPADYQDLTAATADEALVQVLNERRRELMYHGLRWFDLKRLNREPRFAKTLTRVYNNTTYTLEPNTNRYVMQIAPKIIGINPNIYQNNRD